MVGVFFVVGCAGCYGCGAGTASVCAGKPRGSPGLAPRRFPGVPWAPMQRDLTTGSIPRNLIALSLPSMFGFLAQTLYDLVDMAWIGRIGPESVAGVAILTTVFWMIEVLNEIVGTSSVSLISQSYGAKNLDRCARVIEQTLVFKTLVAGIAAVLLWTFLTPLLGLFSRDATVLDQAREYGLPRIAFIPVFFASFTVNTAFRNTGDARTPMFLMILSSVMNVVLDPLFMFDVVPGTSIPGLGYGVAGAAWATVISFSTAFLLGFFLLLTGHGAVHPRWRGLFRLDADIDRRLMTIGLPSGFNSFSFQFAAFVTLMVAGYYGTDVLAALGIGNRIFGFFFLPLVGLLMGGGTMVGANLGASRVDRAEISARWAAVISASMMALFTTVAWAFTPQILRLFIDDATVVGIGVPAVRIVSLGLLVASFSFGFGTVFFGSGHTRPYMYASIVGKWLVQIPFLLAGYHLFHWPVTTVWISFVLGDLANAAAILVFYKKGDWRAVRV